MHLSSSRSLLVIALGALAFVGCRVEKPATPVPATPTIESFTVSNRDPDKGASVTLTWKTSNATTIDLREASAGDLGVPVNTLEGTHSVTVETDSLFVLTAKGPSGSDARAISVVVNEAASAGVTLQALPPIINGGASSTLAWTAPGATTVTLTANGQALPTQGQLTAGALTVTPSVDTTYVLTADDRTATATVTVTPAVLSLTTSARAALVGDEVTVSWTASGADRVVLSSPGRGQLHEATAAADIASGSFVDTVPALPNNSVVTYVVEAFKGTEHFERSVELNVGTGLTISRFDAPTVAAAGGTYQVRWETLAADAVELKVDGATVYRSPTRALAANGLFGFTVGSADFAVEITATNSLGASISQLAQVDTVGVPTGATLSASPSAITAGQPVTLTWAALEARRVRITDSTGQAIFSTTGQSAEGGSVTTYPTADTTFTLTADNLLGSMPVTVTATAAVTVTGANPTLTTSPPTPYTGQNVSISTATPGAVFHGFPHAQVLSSSQADFRDISATGARVIEQGTDVVTVTLPFSTRLWGVQQTGPLTISRAGWMAFGAPVSVVSTEVALPSTSAPRFIIAPYWDDLTMLATSAVYAQVLGSAPEETLVVQWQNLRVGTTATNLVTFQARVTQRGVVSFHYRSMVLPSSPGFVTGVQDGTRTLAVRSTATPTSNSALYFFSPVTAPFDVRMTRGSFYGGFVQNGDSFSLVNETSKAVTLPNDLSLTEFMFRPAAALGLNGQYIEVINRTNAPLDLTSWQLRVPGVPTFDVPNGFTLQPGVPVVIGATADPVLNDDAGVSLAWASSGFHFPEDGGSFTVGTNDAGGSGFTYSGPADGGRGEGLNIDPGPIVGTTGSPGISACAATTTFGSQTPLQRGSPGVAVGCFPYEITSIPVRYVDIADAGGIAVHTGTGAEPTPYTIVISDGGTASPVTFGAPRPVVSMSHDGWLVYGSVSTSNFSNTTNPSTSSVPVGPLALFWDDLDLPAGSGLFWKHFAAGEDTNTPQEHWVFQWSHVRHYNTSPSDDLNFEAKLFVNGVIEYHYGTMTSGTALSYADGNSATVWLARPAGDNAYVIGINQPVIQPNTAYRFTPR